MNEGSILANASAGMQRLRPCRTIRADGTKANERMRHNSADLRRSTEGEGMSRPLGEDEDDGDEDRLLSLTEGDFALMHRRFRCSRRVAIGGVERRFANDGWMKEIHRGRGRMRVNG